jgi:hypothetical protein
MNTDEVEQVLEFFHPRVRYLLKLGVPIQLTMPTCIGAGIVAATSIYDIHTEEEYATLGKFSNEFLNTLSLDYNHLTDRSNFYYVGNSRINSGQVFTINYPFRASNGENVSIQTLKDAFFSMKEKYFSHKFSSICFFESKMYGEWLKKESYELFIQNMKVVNFLQDLGFTKYIKNLNKKNIAIFGPGCCGYSTNQQANNNGSGQTVFRIPTAEILGGEEICFPEYLELKEFIPEYLSYEVC